MVVDYVAVFTILLRITDIIWQKQVINNDKMKDGLYL